MVAIRGRFDGKVFVPQETVDLPRNQLVILHVESVPALPPGTPGSDLLSFAGSIPKEDADEMMRAIDEAFGQVDEDGW